MKSTCCLIALFFINLSHAANSTYSRILPSLGPTNETTVAAVATDSAGNVYVTGSTQDQAFPTTPGVVQPKAGGGSCNNGGSPFNPPTPFSCPDAFVVKLDPQGNVLFATYLGGSGYDAGTSIAVDVAGNIYVAGITAGEILTSFPSLPGSTFTGGATFIAKLNPTGTTLLYTASIPGTGELPFLAPFQANVPPSSVSMSMTVDAAGNAYFAASGTLGFPASANALQKNGSLTFGKLDPTGSQLIYATYFGGSRPDLDRASAIAIDAQGNAYVTGIAGSSDFPVTSGVLQSALSGSRAAFVTKLNAAGSGLVYSTLLGGGSFATGAEIRVDTAGDAYVLGTSNGAFPVTPGSFKTTFSAGDSFLAKLTPDASALVYATFLHTNGVQGTIFFDIDTVGDAFFAGQAGSNFPATPNALQPCHAGGGTDAVVGELGPEGHFVAGTFFGGSGADSVSGMALNTDGSVVLTGFTSSTDFPVTQTGAFGPPGYFAARLRIRDPNNPGVVCLSAGLQNGASFLEEPAAPGELITLRGLRLGPDTGAHEQLDANGLIATNLAGTRVFFDGIAAPLLYTQSQQINAQVPWELAGAASTRVHVEFNGASTDSITVPLATASPAFFLGDFVTSQGAILNADGSGNSVSNPAKRGTYVAIFGTGGGATNPASITGGITPIGPLFFLTQQATLTIDGNIDAPVVFNGAAPALSSGIFQINFLVPHNLSAALNHAVMVKIGGVTSDPKATVTIAVE